MRRNYIVDYDETNSEAMRYMTTMYGKLNFNQYRQIALYLIANNENLAHLDRNKKRLRNDLFKWYNDNFDAIKPLLDNILFVDEDHNYYGARKDEMQKR